MSNVFQEFDLDNLRRQHLSKPKPVCPLILLMNMMLHWLICIDIPRAPMTSIFEGQPPQTRPFPIKTRVTWGSRYILHIISNICETHTQNRRFSRRSSGGANSFLGFLFTFINFNGSFPFKHLTPYLDVPGS